MEQASLFALGSNGSGQLGIGHTNDENNAQQCRLLINGPEDDEFWPSPIRMVKGGGNHTLVLLEDGSLFVSGNIEINETGLDALTGPISSFKRVPNTVFDGKKVKLCSALWNSSIIVTEDDDIYTVGSGSKAERGMGHGVLGASEKLNRFLPPGEHVVDLASGMAHTIIVLSKGDVWGWGNGRKGQIGEPAGIVWKPRKIEDISFKVVRAVCGRDFSYLMGDPSNGHHAIFGSDKWNVRSDAPVAMPDWLDIGASWGSIFVLNRSGRLHAWGRNDHGQLGAAKYPDPIKAIAAGSEHAVILTQNGAVAFCGWGEHGNCGPRTDPQGDVKEWFQHFPPYVPRKSFKVLGIAAGCATSFVWVQPPVVGD
ncbi:MAG: hypothetical protein LQ352_007762 [Teloschistes flavicans]|nr:MAG: hypothetical protein LQ352_007762 [Teloschistes flavicans]